MNIKFLIRILCTDCRMTSSMRRDT